MIGGYQDAQQIAACPPSGACSSRQVQDEVPLFIYKKAGYKAPGLPLSDVSAVPQYFQNIDPAVLTGRDKAMIAKTQGKDACLTADEAAFAQRVANNPRENPRRYVGYTPSSEQFNRYTLGQLGSHIKWEGRRQQRNEVKKERSLFPVDCLGDSPHSLNHREKGEEFFFGAFKCVTVLQALACALLQWYDVGEEKWRLLVPKIQKDPGPANLREVIEGNTLLP